MLSWPRPPLRVKSTAIIVVAGLDVLDYGVAGRRRTTPPLDKN
jgi:hypothetical protein